MNYMNEIKRCDSLEFLKKQKDFSIDVNYSDPPYNLGSEIIVRPDGRMDYFRKGDFMNKWEAMSGDWWAEWFKEAYRTLKYGGYCVMFSIDRQCSLFKYYAIMAGFSERQSIYWFFCSNFPKSADLSKNLDKNAGAERKVVGIDENKLRPNRKSEKEGGERILAGGLKSDNGATITAPSTLLAKKYDGYKYSICPLKQCVEIVMIFQKSYKTKSCLHDVLAYENGDKECCCGALNIEKGRVGTEKITEGRAKQKGSINWNGDDRSNGKGSGYKETPPENPEQHTGRYPAQTFCNSQSAEVLDRQSGDRPSWKGQNHNSFNPYGGNSLLKSDTKREGKFEGFNDTGGCSKILHKCDFEKDEHDIYFYCSKVSKQERNAGCEGMEDLEFKSDVPVPQRKERPFNPVKNFHPCLKPISLNRRILQLFKTPNPQKIIYPFAGSFSEVIGGYQAGFKDFIGCEISEEYIKIGEARFKHYKNEIDLKNRQKPLF